MLNISTLACSKAEVPVVENMNFYIVQNHPSMTVLLIKFVY